MKKVVIALGVLSAVTSIAVTIGCNNSSCTYVSKCNNDPTPSQDAVTLCDNRQNDPTCGGKFGDYLSCIQSNQTCTETGITDETITNGKCGNAYAAWQDCYYGIGGPGFDASAE